MARQKFLLLVTILFAAASTARAVTSLSLEDGLNSALTKSRQVKASQAEVEAADKTISKATSEFFPTLGITGDVGTNHDRLPLPGDLEVPGVPRDYNLYNLQLEAKEVLFSGFSTSAKIQSGKADKHMQEEKLHATEEETRMDLIETYFGIQMIRRKILVEDEVRTLRKAKLDEMQSRKKAGTATDIQLLSALEAVQSQEPVINGLKAKLENASLHLNRLLGASIEEQYELTDDLQTTAQKLDQEPLPDLSHAFEKAIAHNSELRQLEAQSEKINADLKVADAENLPTISAKAFGGFLAYAQNEIGTQNSTVYGVAIELNAPIFSGLSTIYSAQEKRAKLEAVTEERAHARETLLEQLQQAYRDVELNRENLKTAQVAIELAHKLVKRADHLYRAGAAKLTDVLTAYSQLLTAEESVIDDHYKTIKTITSLKNLLGE